MLGYCSKFTKQPRRNSTVDTSTFAILQVVDGVAFKRAGDSRYASPSEEKELPLELLKPKAEQIGINSIYLILILQGRVAAIFGVAIAKSALLNI